MVHTFQGKADKERKVEGVKGGWDQKVVGMILEEMKRAIREERTPPPFSKALGLSLPELF